MAKTKKPALGKGLSALLENAETDVTTSKKSLGTKSERVVGSISKIPVSDIEVNPFQPRIHFDDEAMSELVESIKEHGIIQPITVRKLGYDKYQLISGERRFRASQLAGLTELPAYIRVANDQTMLEMALVENIQRHDLDAMEVAMSFKRLIDECNLTQEELSEKVSKNRTTVTNYLRLLKLPVQIQLGIRKRLISMGHARALLGLTDETAQLQIFERIINEKLSVRKVEEIVNNSKNAKDNSNSTKKSSLVEGSDSFRRELIRKLSANVNIQNSESGKGKITIFFNNSEELEKIVGEIVS
ncbi:MAG: ParB/RepB/Spo0J family partition protein [Flavobacteriales bacterium]|nr:ParB/RepB/Spo0J family partition protein [Flavobacteriales bacterium]